MEPTKPYPTPDFFLPVEAKTGRTYAQWLTRRARALRDHDRDAGNHVHVLAHYRKAIDTALRRSGGIDEYNGKPIDWLLAFENRNGAIGGKRRRSFAAAPSIDHVTGGGLTVAVCRDETNTAKGCMTTKTFYEFCAAVVAHGPRFCAQSPNVTAEKQIG